MELKYAYLAIHLKEIVNTKENKKEKSLEEEHQ